MSFNTFLVKSAAGWSERNDADATANVGFRQETRLDLGALKEQVEIDRVADGQLAEFAVIREELTHVIDIQDNFPTPYIDYGLGAMVATKDSRGLEVTERILAFTGSVDNKTALVTIAPTVKNIMLPAELAVMQAAKKMVPGTVTGQSKAAQPVLPRQRPIVLVGLTKGID